MPAHLFTALCAIVALSLISSPAAAGEEGTAGVVQEARGRPANGVVVWLKGVPGPPPPTRKAVLDQRSLTFIPRVMAVRVGTAVEMPNSDRVYHNVFSFKNGKKFDLGLYPVGETREVTFDRPGISRIFCNIHPNMAAYVVAVDSAYFGVSDNTGRFTMPVVPPGVYSYEAWRPSHGHTSGQVVVEPGRVMAVILP